MKQNSYEISVDALGMYHHKDGNWSFVAVNMDIWGYGNTEEEAFNAMVEAVGAQVSFALHKKDMSLIDFPAEDKYLQKYKETKLEALYNSLSEKEEKKENSNVAASIFPDMLRPSMVAAFA
jgi:hypothetical protein